MFEALAGIWVHFHLRNILENEPSYIVGLTGNKMAAVPHRTDCRVSCHVRELCG